jgi:hypothetical protein
MRLFDARLLWRKAIYLRRREKIGQDYQSYEDFFNVEVSSGFQYTRLKSKALLGYEVNLSHPSSFNEKLIHRRLFSRSSVWPVVTDKIAVRGWISKSGLDQYVKLIPAHHFYDVESFEFSSSDEPVVIKAGWASGLNIFVKSPGDIAGVKEKLSAWKAAPYKVESLIWSADRIKRGFLVERMLLDAKGKVPVDYKFFVFHGRVYMIQVDVDRFSGHMRALYSRFGERLPCGYASYKPAPRNYGVPEYVVDKMVPVAEMIGAAFDFVRVDLYWHGGAIFFGEITQTPSAGFGRFTDKSFDNYLGSLWGYRLSSGERDE